jgi:hypothetical protein
MLFVPYVPAPPPPSPRAQELGRRLRETIEGFLQEHPGTTGSEIRQALQLAAREICGKGATAAVAVGAGLAILGALALVFMGRQVPGEPRVWILGTAVGLGVIAIAAAIALKRR